MAALFCMALPYPEAAKGVCSTEAEGVAPALKYELKILFATEKLEAGDGIELVRRCHGQLPDLRTLISIETEKEETIRHAIEAGCNGIMLESRIGKGTVFEAFRAVQGGGFYADPATTEILRSTTRGESKEAPEPLTEREIEVLGLLMQGFSNKHMALALYVSPETIKSHVSNILLKFQARDRTHAAVIGLRLGIVSWD